MQTTMTSKAELIRRAEEQQAKYPQYKGHWDKWEVATAMVDIKNRSGAVIVKQGEQVLVQPDSFKRLVDHPQTRLRIFVFCTIYSERNYGGCDTSVDRSALRLNFTPDVKEKSWLSPE